MSKLTYEDLSNFTHDELSNLTHCDLALDKLELISKSENGTIVLPDDILEKIKQLFDEVSKLPEFQEKTSNINIKTVTDAFLLLRSISEFLKSVTGKNDLISSIISICDNIRNLFN